MSGRTPRLTGLLLVIALVLVSAVPATAGLTGAVWTTTAGCAAVNYNVYGSKSDVYLTGGPKGGGAGVPDDDYYFQVTNPAGNLLLSTTPVSARTFTVSGGVTTVASTSSVLCDISTDRIAFQLAPFDNSPNGVYKVWIIRQADYDAAAAADPSANFGFNHSDTKTDNFKAPDDEDPDIDTDALVTVVKFYDLDGDGTQDSVSTEPYMSGWEMTVTDLDTSASVSGYTDGAGSVTFTGLTDGTNYSVTETLPTVASPPGAVWVPTTTGGVTQTFTGSNSGGTITFGNRCEVVGQGRTIGYWSNKNGQAEAASLLGGLTVFASWYPNGTSLTTTGELSAYLLGASAGKKTTMYYMLSAQMMATWLNVASGKLPGAFLVETPDGWMTLDAALVAAKAYLVPTTNANKATQGLWKDLFDDINNNATPVVAPGPESCSSD